MHQTEITRSAPFSRSALALILVVLAAGCASVGAPQRLETLSGSEQLRTQPDGVRSWLDSGLQRYDLACIGTRVISFGAAVDADEAERQALRDELRDALKARLQDSGYEVCDEPAGRSSLTLRAAITAVERARPTVNAITTVLLFAPLSRGGLTVEFEALDSMSGRRVAAMAFEGRAGVEDVGAAFSALGHAKQQCGIAAARFVSLVASKRVARPVSPTDGAGP